MVANRMADERSIVDQLRRMDPRDIPTSAGSLMHDAANTIERLQKIARDTVVGAAGVIAETLRAEAATCKLGECMPAGRFPEGVSRYNALMWAAELIEERGK